MCLEPQRRCENIVKSVRWFIRVLEFAYRQTQEK